MRPVFQDKFGYPTGNCFNAAVASVLELDAIPDIDPTLPAGEWREAWGNFFTARRLKWESVTVEPEASNWDWWPDDVFAIANVAVAPGIGHSVVFHNGWAVHDVAPGSPFLSLSRQQQREYRILSWAWFAPLPEGHTACQHWAGAAHIPDWSEAVQD